ncbi:MAG: hypothetical protein U5N27_08605 [Rhizobium sp.]|nr:hypothetical protein [Rhizobium sp.]
MSLPEFGENDRAGTGERQEIQDLSSNSRDLLEDLQTKFREVSELHDAHKDKLEM